MLNSIRNPKQAIAATVMVAVFAGGTISPAAAQTNFPAEPPQFATAELPAFLADTGATALTETEMQAVQGEGWPALLYYAVLAAPTLHSLLYSSIANHFPVMIIRQAWNEIRN